MKTRLLTLVAGLIIFLLSCDYRLQKTSDRTVLRYPDSKPLTRWWWFASEIQPEDVRHQLEWLKENEFGGVEIAFVYPQGGDTSAPRYKFLGEEFNEITAYTKNLCDSLGLHCDFTFGTLWPFGGSFVENRDATKEFGSDECRQWIRFSWQHPVKGRVLNHMDEQALQRYAGKMLEGLGPAMAGRPSGWFCDSWEVETRRMWTKGFGQTFRERFGYDVEPFMENLYAEENAHVHYDYMTLVSEYVVDEFYETFTEIAHQNNAFTRVQCAGAPADLLDAYAVVDVPESEAILFLPEFSRIPASAAALTSKPEVSAETFTCLYGWKGWPGPGPHQKEEQTADLKLLCDALFARGVNQVVWHGMPFNAPGDSNMFYASVHVGPDGNLAADLPEFNRYMQKVSKLMKSGKTYSDIAMYIPTEDARIKGEYPEELQLPWAWGEYEMRYIRPPDELQGYQPLWINGRFLEKSRFENGKLLCGDAAFSLLYVDVEYLADESLDAILGLAEKGLPVVIKQKPAQPGHIKADDYQTKLDRLMKLKNVYRDFNPDIPPLVESTVPVDFWCRDLGDELLIFFPHPLSRNLKYPLKYDQAAFTRDSTEQIRINAFGRSETTDLVFHPDQSIVIRIGQSGELIRETLPSAFGK